MLPIRTAHTIRHRTAASARAVGGALLTNIPGQEGIGALDERVRGDIVWCTPVITCARVAIGTALVVGATHAIIRTTAFSAAGVPTGTAHIVGTAHTIIRTASTRAAGVLAGATLIARTAHTLIKRTTVVTTFITAAGVLAGAIRLLIRADDVLPEQEGVGVLAEGEWVGGAQSQRQQEQGEHSQGSHYEVRKFHPTTQAKRIAPEQQNSTNFHASVFVLITRRFCAPCVTHARAT